MSLNRYTNNEDIKSLNVPQFGQHLSEKESTAFKSQIFIPKLSELDPTSVITESHIYTLSGDHIDSFYDCKLINDSQPESPFSIFFDVKQPFNKANITRGSFKLAFNVISPLLGSPSHGNKQPLVVQEISPDGTELKLVLQNLNYTSDLEIFKQYIVNMSQLDMVNNIIVNFGSNRINKIINFRTDRFQSDVVYIKLLTAVDSSIEQLNTCWFGIELIDSYIDTVILTSKFEGLEVTHVKGPNFRIDVDEYDSTATVFKSWNDLLDSDLVSTQRIIDQTISGSGTATLNIDYSDWENFIFYSSAEERFKNFRYKMQMIESYSMDNGILQGTQPSSGSTYIDSSITGSIGVTRNIIVNQNRINTILNSFDSFERWLYYSPTGSIFTHDVSGSLTPWPKYQVNNKIEVHSATSSFVQNWYSQNLVSASIYDETNYNSLWWSIPEHVLMDKGNSQYQLFVEMIGQHFDNMYMYVKSLTKIHERDEHPERGPSNDLLYHIAKSFGWELQNTRQLTDLWLYKLGTDNTGSIQYSSNLLVKPHEEQTKQVWRRIINNLPYLLKTKGTTRSIKALMSIYGIPQTLISIKEYGGPGLDSDRPIMIEDVFTYKLNINSGSYIEIPQQQINATRIGWDKGSVCGFKSTDLYPTYSRTPDTYEFRFSSEQSGSLGAIPIYVQMSESIVQSALSLVSHRELDVNGSSSYSGSQFYGKLLFESFGTNPQYQYSEYLPLFDGDLWTVRVYNETPISTESLNRIHIARTSDSLYGRIPHESHISMSADVYKINSVYLGGGPQTIYTQLTTNTLSSHLFSQSLDLSGSLQSYKEYFITYNNDTFYNHVQNPLAYHVDSISGSFYTLFRYLPLGSDVQRYDHSTYTLVSSSHADRESNIVSASQFINFTGDQISQYTSINETYYSEVPKIGGNTIRSEKIRIEDNSLLFELSPEARSETSEFDDKPIDSNRLAIVFAPSDHINRDIANHMGFEDIDDWISSPALEFGVNYPELHTKRQEYFQKYTQRYDINSFIRILSVYDYTFFEQIKQLVPGRADLVAGILIEPHIFQRPKVQISRLPTVTNPQWDDTIVYETSQSGVFPNYRDELIVTGSTNIEYFYKTSTIEQENQPIIEYFYKTGSPILEEDFDFQVLYETGSIKKPITVENTKIYSKITGSINYIDVGPAQVVNLLTSSITYVNEISGGTYNVFTASIQAVESYQGFNSGSRQIVVSGSRSNASFTRKFYYYDGYTNHLIDNSLITDGKLDSPESLDSWVVASGVTFETESIILNNIETEKLKTGVVIPVDDFVEQSINTTADKTYVLRFFARPYDTSSILCKAELQVNGVFVDNRKIYYNINNDLEWVNEYRINFTGSGVDLVKIVAKESDLFLYNSEIYPFVDSWTEGWLENENKELKKYNNFTYETWYYQIQDDSSQNNARYKGCKLEGPGINIDSSNTIDGGPVVEIRETNPNSLELNNGSTEGNLRVE